MGSSVFDESYDEVVAKLAETFPQFRNHVVRYEVMGTYAIMHIVMYNGDEPAFRDDNIRIGISREGIFRGLEEGIVKFNKRLEIENDAKEK